MITILGEGGVGKSALALRFSQDYFKEDYDMTIEDEFHKEITINNKIVQVKVQDTAGQEAFKAYRHKWIQGRDAFIIAFTVENLDKDKIKEFAELVDIYGTDDDYPKNIVLAATKIDLIETSHKINRNTIKETLKETFENYALKHNWLFRMTSAKEDLNVDELFQNLIIQVLKKKYPNEIWDNQNTQLSPDTNRNRDYSPPNRIYNDKSFNNDKSPFTENFSEKSDHNNDLATANIDDLSNPRNSRHFQNYKRSNLTSINKGSQNEVKFNQPNIKTEETNRKGFFMSLFECLCGKKSLD